MPKILFLLLLPALVRAQSVLSLEEAVRITLEKNYAIKIANNRTRLASNDNTLGNAGFLPLVTGTAQRNYTNSNQFQAFFPDATGNARSDINLTGVPANSSSVGVAGVWTIFDGLGMFVARDRLGELVKAGQVNAEVTIESTVAQVSNAYYDVIRQQQRVNAQRDALDSISAERVRLARDRYEVGQGAKIEFLSAQVDFNTDKAALLANEQALKNAKIVLNSLLVRDLTTPFEVTDTIPLRRDLDLEALRTRILKQNPSLILATLNTRVADLDIKAQQALLYPQVDLLGGYNFAANNNRAPAGFGARQSRTGAFNFGIRAAIPIFNGNNQQRLVQGARITRDIVGQQEDDLKVQLETALNQAFTDYQNSLQLIDLEKLNLSIARQNVDIALERFRIGVSTSLELREAQRSAVAVETRLIEGEYNAKIAEIELSRLSSSIIE